MKEKVTLLPGGLFVLVIVSVIVLLIEESRIALSTAMKGRLVISVSAEQRKKIDTKIQGINLWEWQGRKIAGIERGL